MTVVLPAPVASFRASRRRPGLASWPALSRWSRTSLPALRCGATSASQMAVDECRRHCLRRPVRGEATYGGPPGRSAPASGRPRARRPGRSPERAAGPAPRSEPDRPADRRGRGQSGMIRTSSWAPGPPSAPTSAGAAAPGSSSGGRPSAASSGSTTPGSPYTASGGPGTRTGTEPCCRLRGPWSCSSPRASGRLPARRHGAVSDSGMNIAAGRWMAREIRPSAYARPPPGSGAASLRPWRSGRPRIEAVRNGRDSPSPSPGEASCSRPSRPPTDRPRLRLRPRRAASPGGSSSARRWPCS